MIGYDIHHQGDGHRQRAMAIAARVRERIVLLGSGLAGRCGGQECVEIADDRPDPQASCEAVSPLDILHYAPLHHAGIRQRVAQLAVWIDQQSPALMVIDVSVEIAMLSRLASIPTVYVRLGGRRGDAGHLQAFRAARRLLAPFHEDLDDPTTPDWVRRKTSYVPGLTSAATGAVPLADMILVVNGAGGGILDGTTLAAAAESSPTFRWRVMGPVTPPRECPANLEILGWVTDGSQEIGRAGIVIGTGGDGVVSAVLAAGRPFVCLPQRRPYDEQVSKAKRLSLMGAAIVLEEMPQTRDWPAIIAQAQALSFAGCVHLHDPDGLKKAADLIVDLARR